MVSACQLHLDRSLVFRDSAAGRPARQRRSDDQSRKDGAEASHRTRPARERYPRTGRATLGSLRAWCACHGLSCTDTSPSRRPARCHHRRGTFSGGP